MPDLLERTDLELIDLEALTNDCRVVVLIKHPKMPQAYESTYGCRFDVAEGDMVLCPPAPLWPEPFVGMVVGIDGSDYRGPIKYLIRKVDA